MIINTELTDGVDSHGMPSKVICISYVDKAGKVQLFNYAIGESEMYKWEYAKGKDVPDQRLRSWDFKPVKKKRTNILSESRIHEIMTNLTMNYPDEMSPLYELNTPDTCFCDIEVNVDDDGFPEAATAKNPVNTISWVHGSDALVLGRAKLTDSQIERCQEWMKDHCKDFNTDYTFRYIYYADEVAMLEDFMRNYFAQADCVTGWNFFGYDYPYLYNRCKRLGIDITYLSPTGKFVNYKPFFATTKEETLKIPAHKLIYDYMEVFAKWDRTVDPKENTKLDWVSGKVLGTKKVEHTLGFKEFWEQKPDEYAFYNAVDSILVREIDNKIKTSNAFFALANLTHVPALVAFSSVHTLEIVQVEYMYREGRVMPFDLPEKTYGDGYEGAYVYDPTPGAYKNVFAVDFRSLYPSIEMQFNISPDTYLMKDKAYIINKDEIATCSGAIYTRKFKGIVPTITEDFFNQRRRYKKEMMAAEHEMYELKEIYEKRFKKAI